MALPAWGDSQWLLPENYTTIQTGDIDGDSANELLGRAPDGMHIYDFDGGLGQWLPLGPTGSPEWSGAEWSRTSYYSTIQTGDVTGDGAADLLARTEDGVVAFEFQGSTWVPLPALTASFTDAGDWDQERYYSTIQTADLDGDGAEEILGRSSSGIQAFGLDAGGWTELPMLTSSFTDAGGWNAVQYYSTIQTADLDGDGRAEVLGRSGAGMTAWNLHPSTRSWVEEAAGGPFGDAAYWNTEPRYFSTITAADIDAFTPLGSPGQKTTARSELVARGATGIQTYRYDPKTSAWQSPSANFPAYTNGAQLKAYQAVNSLLSDMPAGSDVRSQYPVKSSDVFVGWISQLRQADTPPQGVSAKVWDNVRGQIEAELRSAQQVWDWYEQGQTSQIGLTNEMFIAKGMDDTAAHLQHNNATNSANIEVLFAGIVRSLGSAIGPGGSVVGGLVAAATSAGVAFQANSQLATFEGTVDDILGQLEATFVAATDGVGAAKQAVMCDYGLLVALSDVLAAGSGSWSQLSQGQYDLAVGAGLRSYSTWVWQTITPGMSWVISGASPTDADWSFTDDTGRDWHYSLQKYDPWKCPDPEAFPKCNPLSSVSSDLRSQLFGDPSSCASAWDPVSCNYGANPEEVFFGLDGWTYECVDGPDVIGACEALAAAKASRPN